MARMKIPNLAVLALLLVFAFLGPLVLPLDIWAWQWLHFVVVLGAGFVLNMSRAIGAGDAKFAAAAAPFVLVEDAGNLAFLFAGVLLAAFATHRAARKSRAVRRLAPGWSSWSRGDFPMGLALGPTLIFYLVVAAATG
ncbi:hypothetical protein LCGC14_2783960 [marine sediment metagenome]|uniref:Prepilin type IV endopeptidase peptidase domain-containing protein n=1 Tax=marine sediment metagenome TaxID=412755 RepID=A0A0F9BJ13_9ZZZZ